MAEPIPKTLQISLKSALFVVDKKSDKTRLIFGANFGAGLNISNLPLVGKVLPSEQTIEIDNFQVVLGSAPFNLTETAALKTLIPPDAVSLPAAITKGPNLSTDIRFGQQKKLFNLALDDSRKTTQSTASAALTQTSRGGATVVHKASQPGLIQWIPVNKTVGTVTFKRVGGRYYKAKLYFLLDTEMAMGPLTVSLDGLSVGSPIDHFDPVFSLDGLGLSYDKPPVQISGAFLREVDPDGGSSYNGTAIIKTPSLTIAALGAYKKLNGESSLFIYAVLNLAVGVGPPFFQLTGISAGFGYNRALKVPDVYHVKEFPLVSVVTGGPDLGTDPMSVLTKVKQYIPPAKGQLFLAFGVKFTSFKMLDCFALLILRLGRKVRLDLLGMAKLTVPAKTPNPVAEVELALKASYDFDKGSLSVMGVLTPASYILSKQCRLTGGFAFVSWFEGEHAGDFVYTMGGYHPEFNIPAHYPRVPRLGFHWQINPFLSLKGEMYYALVPSTLMAGGRLEALFEIQKSVGFDIGIAAATLTGKLRAWAIMGADFIISWQPYYYKATLYLSIGIEVTFVGRVRFLFFKARVEISFSLSLGANMRIQGPEFSGVAHVDWCIVSFDIAFGSKPKEPPALQWAQFKAAFLPPDKDICTVTVGEGLTRKAADTYVVNPAELVLSTNSEIPSTTSNIDTTGCSFTNDFGIGCMKVTEIPSSHHHIQVLDTDAGNKDVTDQFVYEPILKNAPEAMWGTKFEAELNSPSSLIHNMLMGFRITPKPKKQPDQTEEKLVSNFSYDVELKDNAYKWARPSTLSQENPGDQGAEQRKATLQRIRQSETQNKRSAILTELGLDQSNVQLDELSADLSEAFLKIPEVVV